MHLPYLRSRNQKTEKQTIAFRGINYGEGVTDGQLSDSKNITAEQFPCLAPRKGRAAEAGYENVTGVYYKNGQFLVDGTNLYYDGQVIAQVTEGEKHFVSINTKVVIYPDKIMYDTDTGEVRTLGALLTLNGGTLEVLDNKTLGIHKGLYSAVVAGTGNVGGTGGKEMTVTKDNAVFTVHASGYVDSETGSIVIGEAQEKNASGIKTGNVISKIVYKGETVLDLDTTKQYAVVTKRYSFSNLAPANPEPGGTASYGENRPALYGVDYEIREPSGQLEGEATTLESLGFRAGDTVEIEGMTTFPEINGSYTIRAIETKEQSGGSPIETLVFDADLFPEVGSEAGEVTIRRKTPELEAVCESNNRLWGAEGDTIYASALGDPTNFFTYDGLDTDSYAVAVASEGAFTGCCGFGNAVLFFKENRLYKILGSYPSQYTMYEYNVPGVKLGSEKSLVNINEVLYYHGRDGVYRYSGGAPDLASDVFGMRRFEEASAGTAEGRYYISMKDRQSGAWGMWVYDTLKGLWVQEDDTQAMNFAADEGKLYCIGNGKLTHLNPDDGEEVIAWSATTTRMDEVFHNRKCYSKLLLRGELLEDTAWLQVDVSCDGEPFKRVYTSRDKGAKTLVIPIMPKRCDSFRIRLSGEGKFIIRSLVREFGIGSEY